MKEILDYYRRQGAPGDQTALVGLLKELQQTYGAVPKWAVGEIAEEYKVKESFILAVVKRIPSLRLQDTHLLQLCAGPNCGKHSVLAAEAEKLCKLKGVELNTWAASGCAAKAPISNLTESFTIKQRWNFCRNC